MATCDMNPRNGPEWRYDSNLPRGEGAASPLHGYTSGHALPMHLVEPKLGHKRCDLAKCIVTKGRRHYRARSGGEALLTTL